MQETAKKNYRGFTFIELLIVIAILAIVSAIGVSGFTSAQKKGRDAGRKSDLGQFRNALESYANKNDGLYIAHTTVVAADTICGATELNLGITCPIDVKNGTAPFGYKYISDGSTGATATRYALYAALEAPSPSANTYFGLCSNGSTLSQAAVPTIASCP